MCLNKLTGGARAGTFWKEEHQRQKGPRSKGSSPFTELASGRFFLLHTGTYRCREQGQTHPAENHSSTPHRLPELLPTSSLLWASESPFVTQKVSRDRNPRSQVLMLLRQSSPPAWRPGWLTWAQRAPGAGPRGPGLQPQGLQVRERGDSKRAQADSQSLPDAPRGGHRAPHAENEAEMPDWGECCGEPRTRRPHLDWSESRLTQEEGLFL